MKARDKVWNEAIKAAALTAAGFQCAVNSKAMAPFIHDTKVFSAVVDRDLAIAAEIERLVRS